MRIHFAQIISASPAHSVSLSLTLLYRQSACVIRARKVTNNNPCRCSASIPPRQFATFVFFLLSLPSFLCPILLC